MKNKSVRCKSVAGGTLAEIPVNWGSGGVDTSGL